MMKSRLVLMMSILLVAALAACSSVSESERAATARATTQQTSQAGQAGALKQAATANQSVAANKSAGHSAATDEHGHNHGDADRVPAFQTDKASLKSLSPTLDPQKFSGKQKLAYEAVREIPETIAQLPCYCYCDEGFGHKSLHSCFVDDHAGHCAVCVDEALLAYKLQKEERLTPEQIRERVIAQFSR